MAVWMQSRQNVFGSRLDIGCQLTGVQLSVSISYVTSLYQLDDHDENNDNKKKTDDHCCDNQPLCTHKHTQRYRNTIRQIRHYKTAA